MPVSHPGSATPQQQQCGPINTGTGSFEAARRKRERDRECQRRKRERDRRYTKCLEERIRELEGQLGTSPRPQKTAGPGQATAEECVIDGAWSVPTPSSQGRPDLTARPAAAEERRDSRYRSQSLGSSVQQLSSPAENSDHASSDSVVVSLRVLEACLSAPQWARLPLHGLSLMSDPRHCIRGSGLAPFITSTRADAGLESLCPPTPKVIDILYAGSKNPLANLIVAGCSREPLLAPERLAISWTLYQYCRWLIWPSKESFENLPEHMHPTAMQLTVEHQWCIDLVAWPELRESMIRNQSWLDVDAAIGLFLCSLRMRGSFNTHFICRQNEGDLEINPEFYNRFTDPANWGLLENFWTVYPGLVEGLDPGLKIREKDLLASL
ncbi:hypothetical protein CCM_04866 [Cordyceps militaris CM01]|uniref:BZIP domain-containing protein n=1 Tax=Cordyceps militaris (strain CM01) TaxID=983644 RepID=G3JEZ9_CORMM|nr:uncharacterized protein CCM_04866 [Cordyceps militaris CM01]EGX93492.1 hypothetical protein CCM_04866 [Cordyceps militaris CM01]